MCAPPFEKAVSLEKDPTRNAAYRHALGWIHMNKKEYAQAKEEFTRALAENPDLEGAATTAIALGHGDVVRMLDDALDQMLDCRVQHALLRR